MTLLKEVLTSNTTYDVVVVGAGPSGSATAYWLAAAGWKVCLVEKKPVSYTHLTLPTIYSV